MTKCTDHFGNLFPSERAMCEHYNIRPNTYLQRRQKGLSIEESLSPFRVKYKTCAGTECEDHLGNKFPSMREMCRHHHVPANTYLKRIRRGLSVAEALKPSKPRKRHRPKITDHLGHTYPNIDTMAATYGLSGKRYKKRICSGWTKEEALLLPQKCIKKSGKQKPVFELEGIGYYPYKCDICESEFIFSLEDMRKHCLAHVKEGMLQNDAMQRPFEYHL